MFLILRKRRVIGGLLVLVLLIGMAVGVHLVAQEGFHPQQEEPLTIIIDPGHGGFDAGATGYDGIVEKEINLSISLKLRDLLVANGFSVHMTRETDDATAGKKKEDMYVRLQSMTDYPNSLYISVHQNQFPQSQYHGAQIFYSQNLPESKELAQTIQDAFVQMLQPDNTREIKPAQKNLFLLYKATVPAVIVECGFLSNPTEAQQLASDAYQSKVAFTIFSGIVQYLGKES